jgi:hypothetical protein
MKKRLLLAVLLYAAAAAAQTTRYTLTDSRTVDLPDLIISGSTLNFNVTYDASRAVYRYSYTLGASQTSRVPVQAFKIGISGVTARPQTDPTLAENIVRAPAIQPATTIPVGITVPNPSYWRAGISRGGMFFASARRSLFAVQPSASATGFVLESRLGPGVRKTVLTPSRQSWLDIMDGTADNGAEFVDPEPDDQAFAIATTTVGPADLTDADLFDGGGQQPAEVNKFLRYASPQQSRTKVSANSQYIVIVYYGKTIIPSTFTAALDKSDITLRFHPVPGGADAITIPIGTSTTKLQLSVDGLKSSGCRATDSDTLTFLPQ